MILQKNEKTEPSTAITLINSQPKADATIEKEPVITESWYAAFSAIYRLKILALWLFLLAGTIIFYILDQKTIINPEFAPYRSIPFKALADACLTALVVGFSYEWIVRKESQGKLQDFLKNQLADQTSHLLKYMPKSLLANKEVLVSLLGDDNLDGFIRNTLQIKSGDDNYGSFLYDSLLKKTLNHKQRLENYRCQVTLTDIIDDNINNEIKKRFFQAVIDLRYETILEKTEFKYACVSDIDRFNELLKDSSFHETWFFPPAKVIPQIDASTYKVHYMKVGNINLNIEEKNASEKEFIVECKHQDLASKLNTVVTVHYRYEVKVQKLGHMLVICLIYPTKGVSIELDFAKTDIAHMNVMDFFLSTEPPNIKYSPNPNNPHKVEVELNEWLFPKGGVKQNFESLAFALKAKAGSQKFFRFSECSRGRAFRQSSEIAVKKASLLLPHGQTNFYPKI